MVKQEPRDQESRKREEEHHAHRAHHRVQIERLRAQGQKMACHNQQNADTAPAVEGGEPRFVCR